MTFVGTSAVRWIRPAARSAATVIICALALSQPALANDEVSPGDSVAPALVDGGAETPLDDSAFLGGDAAVAGQPQAVKDAIERWREANRFLALCIRNDHNACRKEATEFVRNLETQGWTVTRWARLAPVRNNMYFYLLAPNFRHVSAIARLGRDCKQWNTLAQGDGTSLSRLLSGATEEVGQRTGRPELKELNVLLKGPIGSAWPPPVVISSPSIALEGGQLQQALAILDRERPSPLEERWFLWLNRSVWSALFWSLLWPIVLFWNSRFQIIPLGIALFSCASVVLLFAANVKLLGKLWHAARTERRLGISKEVSTLAASVGSGGVWTSNWYPLALMSLLPLGLLLLLLGAFFVPFELMNLTRGKENYLQAAITCLAMGLACLSLFPMERAKQRLNAVSRLRDSLLEHEREGHGETRLSPAAYDLIAAIGRTHILMDRQQGVAASRRPGGRGGGVQLSRSFQESLSIVAADELPRLYAVLRELSETAGANNGPAAATNKARTLAIPDTSLAIEFAVEGATGKISVTSLRRGGPSSASEAGGFEDSDRSS